MVPPLGRHPTAAPLRASLRPSTIPYLPLSAGEAHEKRVLNEQASADADTEGQRRRSLFRLLGAHVYRKVLSAGVELTVTERISAPGEELDFSGVRYAPPGGLGVPWILLLSPKWPECMEARWARVLTVLRPEHRAHPAPIGMPHSPVSTASFFPTSQTPALF